MNNGEYTVERFMGLAKEAWCRCIGIYTGVPYMNTNVAEEPFKDDRLRQDVDDVQDSVAAMYPKATTDVMLHAFIKAASCESGIRGMAGSMLHKRHQLNRTAKHLAALNNAVGIYSESGPVSSMTGGLPE